MCTTETQVLRQRTTQHRSSATDVSTSSDNIKMTIKRLQSSSSNSSVGHFTAKTTSPKRILEKHDNIDACKCLVAQAGLENFIRSITAPLNLTLPNSVRFNMNGNGRMQTWEDVYLAESVYTRCLGISKRIYQTHAFTHEPDRKLAYFILEEHNERTLPFLPGFDFYVLVFTYYNDKNEVTAVDVQYDQLSFFLHCVGLAQVHGWLVESVITPFSIMWAKAYHNSGLVNPFTFMLQLLLLPLLLMYCWAVL
ncbi:hypothetical protein ACHAXM_010893 [Skeletonema potamos]|jgi:hypothetical protein